MGSRVWHSPSHRLIHLQLDPDAPSVMVPHAPPTVAPPPVLRPEWETLVWLASRRSKPLDLDTRHPPSVGFVAQPTNQSPLGFEAQTKKLSRWFWGPNHQTVATGFESHTGKPEPLVLRPNQEKPSPLVLRPNRRKSLPPILRPNRRKPSPLILRPNRRKPSPLVLRPNQETCWPWFWGSTKKPTDLSFEAQPRNSCFLTPRARCRPHTMSPDLSIARPPSTWPVQ
jgi:hypothetical protein